MKAFLTLMAVMVVVALAVPGAMAQQTGAVTGTVADTSGALIPGVEVTATNTNTNISTSRVSGEAGSYTIPALQPGPYSIVASLPGFADSTIEVNLSPNQTFRFNFVLQLAGTATQVEVVSDADALLATTSASVGDALPEYEISALPLATRNVFDLLQTTAGVVRTQGGDGTMFAGTRNSAVNTTRDGIVASDGRYMDWNGAFSATFTSPDLVEEVQVSVGTVDAAAGRGSGQVRLQTRSGTNEYHGALFYGTNNSAFNANSWFDNLNGNPLDWTNRQQFGGRLGGPIVEGKAFFFVLIDEQRYNARQNVTGSVWTAEARQGNFRYFPGFQNDDANGANPSVNPDGSPVSGGPAGCVGIQCTLQTINVFAVPGGNDPRRGTAITSNKFIQETLTRMPLPNNFRTGDGLNTAGIDWVRSISGTDNAAGTSQNTNRDNLNIRLDYTITDNNKVQFVMSREHNVSDAQLSDWPGGFNGESTRNPRIYSAGYTSTLSPTVVNEFRWGYRQTSWHGRPPYAAGCCFGDEDIANSVNEEGQAIQELFNHSNGFSWAPGLQTLNDSWVTVPGGTTIRSQISPLWQFGDTISIVSGSHSFQGGWDGTWAWSDGWNSGGLEPQATLGSGNFPITVFDALAASGNPAYAINSTDRDFAEGLLNDLSGSVGNQTQTFVVNDTKVGFVDARTSVKQNLKFTQNDWSGFFKDTWNVTNNLTLNYGVRWDVYGVPYEPHGLDVIPGPDNNYLGISGPCGCLSTFVPVGKGSANPDLGTYPKDWNNIAPSLGWSYRVPWLDRPTVVRGGYGISYSGQATFLQYDFGVGRQQGKSYAPGAAPLQFTQAPGSNGTGIDIIWPMLDIVEVNGLQELRDPNDPSFSFRQFDTIGLDSPIRSSGTLYAYTDDRRIPYIQNFNLSVETEIARDTNLSVAYLGTVGVSLWGGEQINEVNVFANDPSGSGESFMDAFITTRQGGDSPMFDAMLAGLTLGGNTVGTGAGQVSGSTALRRWASTRSMVADGNAASLAEFITETSQVTGSYGGLLRNSGLYPENFIKRNPAFNQVDLYDNGQASNYHALQIQVTKRLSNGFSGNFGYTWSKAMGNSVTTVNVNRQDQSFAVRDPRNRALQWGIVPFNRTHQFNAHGVWNLPFGPGRAFGSNVPAAVARVIEGWTLSGIFGWDSGTPIPVESPLETLAGEDDANTPDLVGAFPRDLGKVEVDPSNGYVTFLKGYTRVAVDPTPAYGSNPDNLQNWDTDSYAIQDPSGNIVLQNPVPGTTGNLAYNWLTGPTSVTFDAAMEKAVRFREGTTFSIRVDAVNLLNTPRWGNPELDITSNNFGRITDASGARTFTLNARIDF